MKIPKFKTIMVIIEILGIIIMLYSLYKKLKNIVTICDFKKETEEDVDYSKGILKTLHDQTFNRMRAF